MDKSPVLTHGILNRTNVVDGSDQKIEELRRRGFTLVDSGYTAGQLEELRERTEKLYLIQVEEMGGEEMLRRCNDANVVRCPLAYDDLFVDVAANPNLVNVIRKVLGENFVLMQQNGLLNRPKGEHYQLHWHRDLAYQHWTSSEPLAINALLALDDFTVETGCTFVLPGSHQRGEFPSDEYVWNNEYAIEAPAGAYLVLDAMLYHRAGQNTSLRQRRAINHLIGRPFLAQQFSIATILGDRYVRDDFLNKYLGYRWAPQTSVAAWRKQRI